MENDLVIPTLEVSLRNKYIHVSGTIISNRSGLVLYSQVQQLADEGIGFEIAYGDALTDSSVRRQVSNLAPVSKFK